MSAFRTYDFLKSVDEAKGKEAKLKALRETRNPTVDAILRLTLDPAVEFDLPDTEPPYTPSKWDEAGNLHQEVRRIERIFVKGALPGASKVKIEARFIELLEFVDKDDAKLLVGMIAKKLPFKSLNEKLVREALPELFG